MFVRGVQDLHKLQFLAQESTSELQQSLIIIFDTYFHLLYLLMIISVVTGPGFPELDPRRRELLESRMEARFLDRVGMVRELTCFDLLIKYLKIQRYEVRRGLFLLDGLIFILLQLDGFH